MATYYFNLNNNKYGAKPISAASCIKKIYYKDKFDTKDCPIYEQHFLPDWAENSPAKFFKAADKFELKNAITYNEFEFTLQDKLNLNQNLEIVNNFIKTYLPDKYYAYTIRRKQIKPINNDKENDTNIGKFVFLCYLIFSERILDEIEKTNARPLQKFFSRYNSKNPLLGGTKKDNHFIKSNLNSSLATARKTFVKITNEILTKYKINDFLNYNNLVQDYADVIKPISVDSLELLTFEHNTKQARILQKLKTISRKRVQILKELDKLQIEENNLKDELNKLISFKTSLPINPAEKDKSDINILEGNIQTDVKIDNEIKSTTDLKVDASTDKSKSLKKDIIHQKNFDFVKENNISRQSITSTLADISLDSLQQFDMKFYNADEKNIFKDKKITNNIFTVTAYNAMQIKNLLTRLSSYLRNTTNFKNDLKEKILNRMTRLKKAVNLQIIKDKYHTYSTDTNTIYYFVRDYPYISDTYESSSIYKIHLSSVNSEYDKDISDSILKNTKVLDLKNAKIIAEALAGNKQASTFVMQIKDDKIEQL